MEDVTYIVPENAREKFLANQQIILAFLNRMELSNFKSVLTLKISEASYFYEIFKLTQESRLNQIN